jgi:hypothetical protein
LEACSGEGEDDHRIEALHGHGGHGGFVGWFEF